MKASVGDRIVVPGQRRGEPERAGRIVEILGAGGAPPYRIVWHRDGHESIFFPSSGAHVEHVAGPAPADRQP